LGRKTKERGYEVDTVDEGRQLGDAVEEAVADAAATHKRYGIAME